MLPRRTTISFPALDATPELRSQIPQDSFPDDLLVYDFNDITGRNVQEPIYYSRALPVLARDHTGFPHGKRGRMRKYLCSLPRNVAHLSLDSAVLLSQGPNSIVFRAPVRLPRGEHQDVAVSVVAKLAQPVCGAHYRLAEEANMFDSVSGHLMKGDAGTSALSFEDYNGDEELETGSLPHFYGFYLPVRKDGSMRIYTHGEECGEDCRREVVWTSPILLMEECEDTVVAD